MYPIVTSTCPITRGLKTRMARGSFEDLCRKKSDERRDSDDVAFPQCQICSGYPHEVEFITMEDLMVREATSDGACADCGKAGKLRSHEGEMVCSTCTVLRGKCKNDPSLIINMLKKFGRLPKPDKSPVEPPAEHVVDIARIVKIGREMAFSFGTDSIAAVTRGDIEFLMDGAKLEDICKS